MPKPTTFAEAVPVIVDLADKQYDLVHGDANTVVETDNGPVPSAAKIAADIDAMADQQRQDIQSQVTVITATVAAGAATATAQAELAAAKADAATAAAASKGNYSSIALGLAGTADGQSFTVTPSILPGALSDLYRNAAGTAVLLGSTISASILQGSDGGTQATDPDGLVYFDVSLAGEYGSSLYRVKAHSSGVQLVDGAGLEARVVVTDATILSATDPDGLIFFYVNTDGTGAGFPGSSTVSQDVLDRNEDNIAARNAERARRPIPTQALWVATGGMYAQHMGTGQSLMAAQDAGVRLPAYSVAVDGNYMIGNSTRPQNMGGGGTWVQFGDLAFQPCVATVQSYSGSSVLYTDAQVAAGGLGSLLGQDILTAAMRGFRTKQLTDVVSASGKNAIVSCAISGRTIEELSEGNATQDWARVPQSMVLTKQLATAAGGSAALATIVHAQGEFNYNGTRGATQQKEPFKTLTKAYIRNIIAKAYATYGAAQTLDPAVFAIQSGASFTVDTYDMAIGQAQLELALEEFWYLVAPYYPVVDNGGHLTSNGYAWIGAQTFKVMDIVLNQKRGWKPLHIRGATLQGQDVFLDMFVPSGKLVTDSPYVARTATAIANWGYTVLQKVGGAWQTLAVASQDIPAASMLHLKLAAAYDPSATEFAVRYADAAHGGNGMIRDTDPTVTGDTYYYADSIGMGATENIAALVGKQYPLYNWAVAQQKSLTLVA